MSGKSLSLAVGLVVLLCVAVGASSAWAQSPWWHLTAEPVPTYLHSGVARDEVQELSVRATGGDVLWVEAASYRELEEGKIGLSELKRALIPYNASAAAAQAALEGLYGPGVEVTGSCEELVPPVSECVEKVTFKNALGGRRVALPVKELFGDAGFLGGAGLEGEASVSVAVGGHPDGEILVNAINLGEGPANGEMEPITVSDVLPAGLEAVGVRGILAENSIYEAQMACSLKGENGVSGPACAFSGEVFPYTALTLHVEVDDRGAAGQIADRASVVGGGGRPLSVSRPVPLGGSTPFGVADYELVNENEGGGADTQAGSHPFQQTTTADLQPVGQPGTDHKRVSQRRRRARRAAEGPALPLAGGADRQPCVAAAVPATALPASSGGRWWLPR